MTKPKPVPLAKPANEGWRVAPPDRQYHYFRKGEALCGKYGVIILGGGQPRTPWPRALVQRDRSRHPVCVTCETTRQKEQPKRQPPSPPVPRPARPTDARTNHRSQHQERGTGRTRSDLVRDPATPPTLTADTAYEFVKLLHAGLSGLDALAYIAPDYLGTIAEDADAQRALLTAWARSRLVLEATTKLNSAPWQSLDPEARLQIALDKHYAELAYFLYTHDWSEAEGTDLKKATDAREALAKRLEGSDSTTDSPMAAFMRAVQSGEIRMGIPPQLTGLGLLADPAKLKGDS